MRGGLNVNRKSYCPVCDTDVVFTLREESITQEIDNLKFNYLAKVAYCSECGNEIYIPELSDNNIRIANRKYRELKNLIQVEEIQEIIDIYAIGKKPLSTLLGWGEITILRYLQGFTPRKDYSDQLMELRNPQKMLELFEANKQVLPEPTQRRVGAKIVQALQSQTSRTCFDIAKYFLSKLNPESEEVITPLKLQKLVYYAQGWLSAFHDYFLFPEDFEAWVHGPVIPALYFEYKQYGYSPIPKAESINQDSLSPEIKAVLNMVHNIYGRYDGKYLEELTHKELPWVKARGNCKEDEVCDRIIPKNEIRDFFAQIKKSHKINSVDDLPRYVRSL